MIVEEDNLQSESYEDSNEKMLTPIQQSEQVAEL